MNLTAKEADLIFCAVVWCLLPVLGLICITIEALFISPEKYERYTRYLRHRLCLLRRRPNPAPKEPNLLTH